MDGVEVRQTGLAVQPERQPSRSVGIHVLGNQEAHRIDAGIHPAAQPHERIDAEDILHAAHQVRPEAVGAHAKAVHLHVQAIGSQFSGAKDKPRIPFPVHAVMPHARARHAERQVERRDPVAAEGIAVEGRPGSLQAGPAEFIAHRSQVRIAVD